MMVIIFMLCLGYCSPGGSTIRCARSYFCHCLILRIMQRHDEKEISSDGVYVHALFGLLIAWGIIIRCARSYLCTVFILRIIHNYCEK